MKSMPVQMFRMTENQWRILIAGSSFAALLLTIYCLSIGISIIFTHFYYVPIILLAYRYRIWGFSLAILLSLAYLALVVMFGSWEPLSVEAAVIRSLVFIGIAALVMYLSEHLMKIQDTLQETLEIQNGVIQNANVWLMVLDARGRILEWNTAAEEMTGYTSGEVLGKNDIWKILYPEKEYRKEITARISEIIQKDDYFANLKTVITSRDGSQKTMLWNTRKFPGGGRDQERYIAIGTDITDLSRAEEELRKSEGRFRTLFENMLDGFAYCQMLYRDGKPDDFVYLGVNKAFGELTGLHDVVGKRVTDLIPGIKEETPEIFSIYARVADTGNPEHFEINFTPLGIQPSIAVYSPERGYFVAIFEDITDRKKAEERKSFLSAIIDYSNDGIIGKTLGGTITSWNAGAEMIYGYSAGEIVGRNVSLLIPPDYPDDTQILLEKIRAGEQVIHHETTRMRKDGRIIDVALTLSPIKDSAGSLVGVSTIARDITEQKKAEEYIKFSNALLLAQQEVSLDAILVVDSKGKIISWNERFIELWHMPPDILASRSDEKAIQFVLAQLADPDEFLARVRVLYTHPEEKSREEITLRDGRTIDRYSAPMVGKDGKYYGRIWYFRDITSKKQADRVLQDSEARFKNLFEKMNAGVAIYEAIENGEDFIFKEINPAVERIEHVRREDVVGHRLREIFPAVKEFGLFDVIQRVWKTGETEQLPLSVYQDDRIAGWRVNTVYKLPSGEIVAIYEDVTEKMQAEEALAASEEKFRGVAERSFDLILLTDKSSLLTYVSPSVIPMLGYRPDEVVGRSAFEFVDSESLGSVQEGFLKNVEGFTTGPLEVSVRKKDGGYAILEISGASIRKDGVFAGMQVIGRDITRKKADQDRIAELLKIQEEQLRIINTSPAVSFLWKAEENWPVEMVSNNITQFGYTPDELLSGRISFGSIVHPDDLDRVEKDVEYNSIHGIDEFFQQYRILGRDGKIFWIDDFTHIRRDADGKITHYEGIVLDITERKQAEEALRESERRNALLLDAIPDLMFIISRDGIYQDFTAPEGSSLLIPRQDVVGKSIWDTPGFTREFADSIMSHINQAITTRQLQHFEYNVDSPVGKRYYEARTVALNENEALSIVRDITEQKQAEELQRHFTEKLEQEVVSRTEALNTSLQEKVVLLREVHHRVKNNLQIIISLTNLQMRNIDDVHLKQALAETQNRVKAMSLVHENLYQSDDLSKINFSAYVRSLVSQLFTYYGVKSQKISLQIDIGAIMIDINTAIPLGLAINELVSNVVKHAFPGERSGKVFITAKDEKNSMTITIQDTGIGLPEAFDWRHTNSLGLHLVSALVEQVHGSVDLVKNGPGTTFRMVIPISAERA
jgi:PAS domain S-box-containing protein